MVTILPPESLWTDTPVSFWSKPRLTSRIFLTWAASTRILWWKKKETVLFPFCMLRPRCFLRVYYHHYYYYHQCNFEKRSSKSFLRKITKPHDDFTWSPTFEKLTSPWTRSVVCRTASCWFKIAYLESSGNHAIT